VSTVSGAPPDFYSSSEANALTKSPQETNLLTRVTAPDQFPVSFVFCFVFAIHCRTGVSTAEASPGLGLSGATLQEFEQ